MTDLTPQTEELPPDAAAVEGQGAGGEPPPELEDLDDDVMEARLEQIEQQAQRDPNALQEVKRMRAQLKRQRENQARYAPLEQYDEDNRAFLLDSISALSTDPGEAANRFMWLVQNIYGENFDAYMEHLGYVPAGAQQPAKGQRQQPDADDLDDAEDAGVDLSDPAKLMEFLDRRDAERQAAWNEEQRKAEAVEHAKQQMFADLKAEGIDDPSSEEAIMVLSLAKAKHNLNIKAAAAALRKKGVLGTPAERPGAAASNGQPAAAATPPQGTGTQQEPARHVSLDERLRLGAEAAKRRFESGGVPAQ